MLTKEQIKEESVSWNRDYILRKEDFEEGANWAVEQLTPEIERLQASIQKGAKLIARWAKTNEELQAENTRLKAVLGDISGLCVDNSDPRGLILEIVETALAQQ